MILNPLLRRLEKASSLQMLLLAMKNGLAFTKLTGVSLFGMMKSAMAMQKKYGFDLRSNHDGCKRAYDDSRSYG
jgi:hypothetical protein